MAVKTLLMFIRPDNISGSLLLSHAGEDLLGYANEDQKPNPHQKRTTSSNHRWQDLIKKQIVSVFFNTFFKVANGSHKSGLEQS